MGCAGAREKIEDKMMLMKLERMEVQMEKEKRLKQLSELEGHAIKRNHIPDYIDPKFAREKQLYDDDDEDDDNENIGDKKTDDVQRKIKKDKNDKKAKGKNDKKEKGKNDKKEKGKNDKKKGKKDVDKKKVKKK